MKAILASLLTLGAATAQAHESLVPHTHPHGVSMLPDLDSLVVGSIFMIAAAIVAYVKLGQR
jgi:hypothetical protein